MTVALRWAQPVIVTKAYPGMLEESEDLGEPAPSPRRWLRSLLKRRPSGDVLWLIGGQALLAIGQLAGIRLLTDTVRPEIYGTVSIVLGLVVLGRSQFSLPFAMAAMRQYAEAKRRDDVGMLKRVLRHWLTRSQGIAAALVVLVGFPYCFWQSISLWLPLLTFGLFVVDGEITMKAALLNASRRHRSYSLLRGAEAWTRPILAVALVHLFRPSAAVVLVGFLGAGLMLVAVISVGRSAASETTNGPLDQELSRRVWRFSMPLLPIAPVEWVSSLSDRYLIGGMIGLDAAGIYAASYGLISQPFLMGGIVLENYYRPHYYDALADNEPASAQRIFTTWYGLTAAMCVLGLIAVIVLKSLIVTLFLAESYRSAASLLFPIALGNAFFALSQVSERFLHGQERTGLCVVSRTIGAVISVVAGVPMIYLYGIEGAAWAVPIYYGCQLASAMLIVHRTALLALNRPVLNGQDA
jgi:O-antigen/teichoic acid export membrane protein